MITPSNAPRGTIVTCLSNHADAEIRSGQEFEVQGWNITRISILVNGAKKWVKAQYFTLK